MVVVQDPFFNTFRLRQNDQDFADDIFRDIFVNEIWVSDEISGQNFSHELGKFSFKINIFLTKFRPFSFGLVVFQYDNIKHNLYYVFLVLIQNNV